MEFNFEGVTNTIGKKREHYLLVTASTILPNVENFNWTIYHQTEITDYTKTILIELSKINNNSLVFIKVDESLSVGKIKSLFFNTYSGNRKYMINIDDDFIFPYSTLKLLNETTLDKSIYTYGNFDIINSRNYKDWDDKKRDYLYISEFINEFGKRCVPYHLWEIKKIIIPINKMVAGTYIANIQDIKNSGIIELWSSFEKGIRGYDAALEKYFKEIFHIFSATIVHIGVDDGYFNERFIKDSIYCGREE